LRTRATEIARDADDDVDPGRLKNLWLETADRYARAADKAEEEVEKELAWLEQRATAEAEIDAWMAVTIAVVGAR
jgi:hypothetical protein